MTKCRMWKIIWFALVLQVHLYPVGKSFARAQAVSTDICVLAADPQRFNNVLVTVTAQYESDGIEREGLRDPRCEESGLKLLVPQHAKGAAKLRAALRGGYPGTLDKTIIGTFTGVFQWNPQEHPPRILDVHSMREITVRSRPFSLSPKPPSADILSHESGHTGPLKPQ